MRVTTITHTCDNPDCTTTVTESKGGRPQFGYLINARWYSEDGTITLVEIYACSENCVSAALVSVPGKKIA